MENILEHWGISVEELGEAILKNSSLRGMVFGYVAELKLRQMLEDNPNIEFMVKDDDHDRQRKGDLRIRYRGFEFRLESKSVQTNSVKHLPNGTWVGKTQVDGSDRRTVQFPDGSSLETTLLLRGEFDILAVNCFAFGGVWYWVFAKNSDLPRSSYKKYTFAQQQSLLASLVAVHKPAQGIFTSNLFALLDQMVLEQQAKGAPR